MKAPLDQNRERPTLKLIAEQADVSVSTVSLVLNSRPGVSPEKRQEIQALLDELGYRKKSRGRPTVSGEETIAFVVYDARDIEASHNPFFTYIQRGIEAEAKHLGYGLRVVYVREGEDIAAHVRRLRSHGIIGIVLDASVMPPGSLRPFRKSGIATVIVDAEFTEVALDSVVIDNVGGAHAAVSHLVGLGHRSIGLLTSSIPNRNFDDRIRAYAEVVNREDGIRAGLDVRVRPTLDGAYLDCRNILPSEPNLPTAFFATNDIMASGLVRVLNERGIEVPGRVSVVGFDDLSLCEVLHPPLTTIRVFKTRMAEIAVQRLAERLSSRPPETVTFRIGTQLVERASTASPHVA